MEDSSSIAHRILHEIINDKVEHIYANPEKHNCKCFLEGFR